MLVRVGMLLRVGKVFDGIDEALQRCIEAQPMVSSPSRRWPRSSAPSTPGRASSGCTARAPSRWRGDPAYDDVVGRHPAHPSTRAVVVVDVERVSDSCGYGVPVMDLVGERDLLRLSAVKRGPDGLAAYRAERNAMSLDGLPGPWGEG
jgi:hypothetical protein